MVAVVLRGERGLEQHPRCYCCRTRTLRSSFGASEDWNIFNQKTGYSEIRCGRPSGRARIGTLFCHRCSQEFLSCGRPSGRSRIGTLITALIAVTVLRCGRPSGRARIGTPTAMSTTTRKLRMLRSSFGASEDWNYPDSAVATPHRF